MNEEVLRTALAESEAENDQWQKKLATTWAELAEERRWREELADLSVDQQREIERLTAALQHIVQMEPCPDCDSMMRAENPRAYARQSLGHT